MIGINGKIVAQGSQFSLKDVVSSPRGAAAFLRDCSMKRGL